MLIHLPENTYRTFFIIQFTLSASITKVHELASSVDEWKAIQSIMYVAVG